MDVLHLDLEVGQSVCINAITLTVVEVQGEEVTFKIDDESTMVPIRLSDLLPRVPK